MRKRLLLATGFVILLLGVAVLFAVLTPPEPVAHIRVVDVSGRPVEGATIEPDGLRPKKGGGHYSWSGRFGRSGIEPRQVRTDADGWAEVAYPFHVVEQLETGEISFAVDHPDFCAQRPFRTVAASPPRNAPWREKLRYLLARVRRKVTARPEPVVLQRGATVVLTGYVGTKDNLITNVQAEISRMWPAETNYWRRTGPVLSTWKASAGRTFLRAVACPEGRPALFSEVVTFDARPGETNHFALELAPGVRVEGRLDSGLPRPVSNGRVCAHVYMDQQDGSSDAPIWSAWCPVNGEGRFKFDSLPEGRLEIMALCDGYLSQDGSPPGSVTTSQRVPQSFDVRRPLRTITIPMERAATCEVTVRDDQNRPLPGATVSFWPNILWGGNGSTIFGSDTYNTEDFFRGAAPKSEAGRMEEGFRATTDGRGVALVHNLPPGNHDYSVWHTNYDMPIDRTGGSPSRSASVLLIGGVTAERRVILQKKGSESLTH